MSGWRSGATAVSWRRAASPLSGNNTHSMMNVGSRINQSTGARPPFAAPAIPPRADTVQNRHRSRASSSTEVRTKFFHRIGIACPVGVASMQVASSPERNARDLRNAPRFHEPLQYRYNHHREGKGLQQDAKSDDDDRKRVDFQETVTVVPIPMRSEYSDRIRTKLWSGSAEMCEAVERNLAEFVAENHEWRSVCLEEEMYVDGETNELIHPVHIELGYYTFGTGGSCQRSYLS